MAGTLTSLMLATLSGRFQAGAVSSTDGPLGQWGHRARPWGAARGKGPWGLPGGRDVDGRRENLSFRLARHAVRQEYSGAGQEGGGGGHGSGGPDVGGRARGRWLCRFRETRVSHPRNSCPGPVLTSTPRILGPRVRGPHPVHRSGGDAELAESSLPLGSCPARLNSLTPRSLHRVLVLWASPLQPSEGRPAP